MTNLEIIDLIGLGIELAGDGGITHLQMKNIMQ